MGVFRNSMMIMAIMVWCGIFLSVARAGGRSFGLLSM